jgi:putative glycosyltransferase (TIGR04372 family)
VSAPLPAIHPRVIDYASQWRNEFMDVYLAARCRLMVSTASGVDAISFFHRRPILFTNLVHWERVSPSYAPPCRALLKLYRRDGRIMTVDEIAGSGVQLRCHTTEDFRRENIEFIDNTPGDIVDGVREMLDLLEGHADAPTAHEEAIYDRMAGRIRQRVPSALTPVRVAASFVRRHPELFLS